MDKKNFFREHEGWQDLPMDYQGDSRCLGNPTDAFCHNNCSFSPIPYRN